MHIRVSWGSGNLEYVFYSWEVLEAYWECPLSSRGSALHLWPLWEKICPQRNVKRPCRQSPWQTGKKRLLMLAPFLASITFKCVLQILMMDTFFKSSSADIAELRLVKRQHWRNMNVPIQVKNRTNVSFVISGVIQPPREACTWSGSMMPPGLTKYIYVNYVERVSFF